MKSIRSLFMIAIGMMAFTSMAKTTATMEQKQKTELVKGFTTEIYAVSVVKNDLVVYAFTATQPNDITVVHSIKTELNPVTVITIDDVGWLSSKQRFTNIPYKEKLLENLFTKDNPARYCRSNC